MVEAIVFPGQGSQRLGMGADLFDQIDEFRMHEEEIDAILGYSVRRLCLEDPDRLLNRTDYTQPALFLTNALHYKDKVGGGRPGLLAGHSLGEYNALWAAGAFDLLTGLRLVQRRGELMNRTKNGAMAAVVGMSALDLQQLMQQHRLSDIDVANFNSPMQTVISGPFESIRNAEALFRQAGATNYVQLPVSAAFHSRYMSDVAAEFRTFLETIRFNPLHTPVIANATARPYPKGEPDQVISNLLVEQIYKPVRWEQSVRYLRGRGVEQFIEAGPGQVLTRLIAQIGYAAQPAHA